MKQQLRTFAIALITAVLASLAVNRWQRPAAPVVASAPVAPHEPRRLGNILVNGSPVGGSGNFLAYGGTPYLTVQSDGATYFGTRGPLLGDGAGALIIGGQGTTGPYVLAIDYNGTSYTMVQESGGTMLFGNSGFTAQVKGGAGVQMWAVNSNLQFYTSASGSTVAAQAYPSGGWFFGASPSDPGANNLQVQGITYSAGGNREAWRGIADTNFVGTTSDRWIAYTSISAARTGTIPCTVGAGTRITVVDASGSASGTNTITISASTGAIHGGTNVINSAYGAKDYVSDGTNCVNVSGLL